MQIVKVVGGFWKLSESKNLQFLAFENFQNQTNLGLWVSVKNSESNNLQILCFLKNCNNLQFQVFETFQRTDRYYERTDAPV